MLACLQVEVPLNTALKIIKLSAGRYDTVFSVMRYVSPVCLYLMAMQSCVQCIYIPVSDSPSGGMIDSVIV